MLTYRQLLHATEQNPLWQHQLARTGDVPGPTSFSANGINADDWGSAEFAVGVAAFQTRKGLVVDGICGPRTARKLSTGDNWQPPAGSDYLYANGSKVIVSGLRTIVTPDEPGGLEYKPDFSGCWVRTQPVDQIVVHAKGAEGTAAMTWSFLKSKQYGVHGSVERDGRVWSYCDVLKYATAHAGAVNDTSIGFEVTNQEWPLLPNPFSRPIVTGDYVIRDPSSAMFGKIWKRHVQGFLFPQISSLVKLITALCDAAGVPKVVPGRNGKVYGGLLPGLTARPGDRWKSVTGKVSFRGVIGHYHVTNGHQDPSPDIFDALLANGFSLVEV